MNTGNNSSNKDLGVGQYLLDKYGNVATLQISKDGGALDLVNGKIDPEGFYIAIDPNTGSEGVLYVKLKNSESNVAVPLPFYKGAFNSVLVKEVTVNVGNTASGCYWGK